MEVPSRTEARPRWRARASRSGPSPSLKSTSSAAVSIKVSRGAGSGPTRLAAFDAALIACGVADFNLVRLSSVIPTGAEVIEVSRDEQHQGGHGDLLFCVYADAYTSTPGELAWAGVAWARAQRRLEGRAVRRAHGLVGSTAQPRSPCQLGIDVGQSWRNVRIRRSGRDLCGLRRSPGLRTGHRGLSDGGVVTSTYPGQLASEIVAHHGHVAVHPRDRRHRPAGRPVLRALRVDVQPAQIALGGPPGADDHRVLHPDE